MILLIDNYDSFSYNLYQMLGETEPDIRVIRNDECTVEEILEINPASVILSPGPGRPKDAGVCEEAVKGLKGRIPILGVCLGHQAICEAYGAVITYARELMHGKQSEVKKTTDSMIFDGLPDSFNVGRYHSLAVDPDTLPPQLIPSAVADDGEIMAVEDSVNRVYGLQFHPESIMTPDGASMLRNFILHSGVPLRCDL